MKKRFVLFLSVVVLLFASCKGTAVDTTGNPSGGNSENSSTPGFEVQVQDDGLHITFKNIPANLVKRTVDVYNCSTGKYNLSCVTEKQQVVYPFIKAGTDYIVSLSLNDSNWNNHTDGGTKRITASGGLGDYSVSGNGMEYDAAQKKLSIKNYSVNKPEVDLGTSPYGYGWIYLTSENELWKNYSSFMAFDTSVKNNMNLTSGTATLGSITDLENGSKPNFWVSLEYDLYYMETVFYTQIRPYALFKYSESASTYYTPGNFLTVKTSGDGFSFVKIYNASYPNVRVKVYNTTRNHSCPTLILDQYYKEVLYDYVTSGDSYTVTLQLWDSNWSNYYSYALEDIEAKGGSGDFYFTSGTYEYDQGTDPAGYVANIILNNAEYKDRTVPPVMNVRGNLYIGEGSNTVSVWDNFNYTHESSKLTIDVSSFIKQLRSKKFYADIGSGWTYNSNEYELSLIYNKDNSFTDTHVKGAPAITSEYTVLKEPGSFKIDSSLQGKSAYVIKYNKSSSVITERKVSPSIKSNRSNSRSIVNAEGNEIGWKIEKDFEPADPGICLGPVKQRTSRTASETTSYNVGDTRSFNYYSTRDSISNVNATLKAVGGHCYVWYCNNNNAADARLNKAINEGKTSFTTLAEKFDALYDLETVIIGEKEMTKNYSNIITTSKNDKVNIFVVDLYTDYYQGQNGGTLGYFFGADYYKKANYSYSNECEMIYIDSAFFGMWPEEIYSTLAHEFQHLLHYINKSLNKNTNSQSWFTEMMSLGTEIALQKECLGYTENEVVKSRGTLFNSGYNFGFVNWALAGKNSTYNYSNASIFMDYLMKNYGGIELLKEIAHNNYACEDSVTAALNKLRYSETFDTVMLKMGQMIVNTYYPDNQNTTYLTLERSITSDISDSKGVNHSMEVVSADLKNINCYTPSGYSYNDRVTFSNCDSKKGPSIMKSSSSFGQLYPKAIAVYQLTTNCGETLEIADPGENIELAIYFK